PVTVVSSFPLGEIARNREAEGRIAKWSVELMGETLTYVPRKVIKSQILADFIAEWTDTQLPPPQIQAECWTMYFDRSVMKIPAGAEKSRSFFDKLEEQAKSGGAAGLAWLTVEADGSLKGPIAKFLTPENVEQLKSECAAKVGDAVIILADTDVAKMCKILSGLRDGLGRQLGLIEENVYKCCWIVDFPMYELDDNGKVAFSHNPFSMPQGGLDALNNMDPLAIKAFQYDIVCNGYELSSGAIRNHRPEIMYRAFEIAGYGRDEVNSRFKALINGLKFGAPPHGGIAPGVDRIVMLL